jgi:ornithine cyclodeaminase/alanine dehydrogenase-like protein (mu-crystallin family)
MPTRLAAQPFPPDALAHPVFVSAEASRQALVWKEVIARLRAAYSVPQASSVSPPRVVARGNGSWLRALAAAPREGRYMGAKIFGFGRAKSVSYLIALFDQESGALAALVDASLITAYRTAGTSAVAVDRLAPPGPARIGVLGSGLEAKMHVRAIAAMRPISSLSVFSPNRANRQAFAGTFSDELGIHCVAVDSAERAVAGASIVLAAARSYDETPILLGRWLQEGMLVVSIGSTLPEQREIDESVVEVSDLIVCDTCEEVAEQTGDMLAAKAAGITFDHKLVSLNDLLVGFARDKLEHARRPMFKSVGEAIQDIVVAELVVEKAIAAGSFQQTPFGFLMKQA